MPEPIYPPPANEQITQPRQLNRWLDKNPQGGSLRRVGKYITLPVFSAANVWGGWSQIVTSFNFEAPSNFSLKAIVPPTNPNYVLCVSYRVGVAVTRYLLWDATGSNFDFDLTTYTGQPILKNFRLEVWDTSQGAASEATAQVFYTSVLGIKDYMWGSDSTLQATGAQITDFWADANTIIDPSVYGLVLSRFRSNSGIVDGVSWTSTNAVDVVNGALDLVAITARYNDFNAVNPNGVNLAGTAQGTVNNLFIAFQYHPLTGANTVKNFVKFNNSYDVRHGITASVNYFSVNGTILTGSNALVENDIYILVCASNVSAFLYNVHTQQATILTVIANAPAVSTTINIGDTVSPDNILEIIPMFNVTNYGAVYNYFFWTYNGPFTLPLAMPTNSISVTN